MKYTLNNHKIPGDPIKKKNTAPAQPKPMIATARQTRHRQAGRVSGPGAVLVEFVVAGVELLGNPSGEDMQVDAAVAARKVVPAVDLRVCNAPQKREGGVDERQTRGER